eukprot:PhF_6_TR4827/c0_g1_i1/m.6703/K06632/WEE1; wee1-like protein kinase
MYCDPNSAAALGSTPSKSRKTSAPATPGKNLKARPTNLLNSIATARKQTPAGGGGAAKRPTTSTNSLQDSGHKNSTTTTTTTTTTTSTSNYSKVSPLMQPTFPSGPLPSTGMSQQHITPQSHQQHSHQHHHHNAVSNSAVSRRISLGSSGGEGDLQEALHHNQISLQDSFGPPGANHGLFVETPTNNTSFPNGTNGLIYATPPVIMKSNSPDMLLSPPYKSRCTALPPPMSDDVSPSSVSGGGCCGGPSPSRSRFAEEFSEVRELGRGKFGRVLCVSRQRDGELFAIKVIDVGAHPSSVELLRREVEVLAQSRVSKCHRIVHLYNFWREGSYLFLQLEYCPLGSLWDSTQSKRHAGEVWSEDYILTVLANITLALHECHSHGICHCDVKLDNILIDSTGMHRLGDFGLAVFLGRFGRPKPSDISSSPSTAWSQEEGDARYLPHDMMNEKIHFKSADIFALGISIYELMSGKPLPKSGAEYHALRGGSPPLCSQYSTSLNGLVKAMMDPDPTTRPTTTAILQHQLLQLRGSSSSEGGVKRLENSTDALRLQQALLLCEYQRLEEHRKSVEDRV